MLVDLNERLTRQIEDNLQLFTALNRELQHKEGAAVLTAREAQRIESELSKKNGEERRRHEEELRRIRRRQEEY